MPITRAAIITEALTWEGTPYHDQSALKGVGADCVGILIGVAKVVGSVPEAWEPPTYAPEWHFYHTEERLRDTVEQLGGHAIPLNERQPGDILLFHYGFSSGHCGIIVPTPPELLRTLAPERRVYLDYILHASKQDGRVIRHRLAGNLKQRARFAFTFPGIADD